MACPIINNANKIIMTSISLNYNEEHLYGKIHVVDVTYMPTLNVTYSI